MKNEIKEYIVDFFKCNDVERAWVLMKELQKKFSISVQEAYGYISEYLSSYWLPKN